MKKINKSLKFEGIIVDAYESYFEHNSKILTIEQLVHPGGVCIAATHDNKNFFMVKQYRFGVEEEMLEFPAGLIDPHEDPIDSAKRELQEETGYEAKTIVDLGKVYMSPGYINEVSYFYYATDLVFRGTNFDENEEIELIEMPLEKILHMCDTNEIKDAKTVALAYRVARYIKKQQ